MELDLFSCSHYKRTRRIFCGEVSLPRRSVSVEDPRGSGQSLDDTFFDGKARTFTFEKYCERLNHAFTDLEQSGETVDVERKIRIFLRGITDPTLEAAKNQVLATYVQLLKLPSITLPNLLTESPQSILTDLEI
jgi:hypothetical protein